MDNRSSTAHDDPVTQASKFFMDFRAGDGTPSVRRRFEKWLRASPEHVRAYLDVAAIWSTLPIGDPEGRINIHALLAAALESDDDSVVELRLTETNAGHRYYRFRPWAIAACLMLMVTLVAAGWLYVPEGRTYSTGIGEQRTLLLADGSTVIMNALTTIRVQMTKEARKITLIHGQAYFHDPDEPARPFIVRTGSTTVRAIGTEFDVNKRSDRTVVTVLEGQVAVAKSSASIGSIERRELLRDLAGSATKLTAVLVPAGEQVTVLAQNIFAPKRVDMGPVTAWMQQRLIFNNTPLEEVAHQFNLYSKRRLVIADPSLRSLGIGGEYSASDPAAMIEFLRSQPALHVIETGDEILVTHR